MNDAWTRARLTAEALAVLSTSPVAPVSDMTNPPNLVDPTQTAAVEMVANVNEALTEGAKARFDGEEAASAEPVPEPESAEHQPPPEGATFSCEWENVDTEGVVLADLGDHLGDVTDDGISDLADLSTAPEPGEGSGIA